MLLLAVLHACCTRLASRSGGPMQRRAGLLASRAFWLGGLASAALWALALEIAFG